MGWASLPGPIFAGDGFFVGWRGGGPLSPHNCVLVDISGDKALCAGVERSAFGGSALGGLAATSSDTPADQPSDAPTRHLRRLKIQAIASSI